jgi:hypothetical protein
LKVINHRVLIVAGCFLAFPVGNTRAGSTGNSPEPNIKAEFGTRAEARALLEKLVSSMKADKEKTLAQINKGDGGFRDRDLYAFCIGPDGRFAAHPDSSRLGIVYRGLRDRTGKAYGEEVSRLAAEGKIGEVDYIYPRPTDGLPTPKVGLYTKVASCICIVGYYKQPPIRTVP